MGLWNNNMWSWKLNWMATLDDAYIESFNELHQLLEQDRRVGTAPDTHTVAALKRLWKNNVPSKVGVFGWRLHSNAQVSFGVEYRFSLSNDTYLVDGSESHIYIVLQRWAKALDGVNGHHVAAEKRLESP
ncbi:hypothetical protein L195_g048679 [Trifolium pratense]|uniref:Uncharacterized protein n=1 Tax=Trifolium pratense TaxID=57577 RepID=A0A2K3JM11_TRIPR|nr:hypothetical protein L195_g048679 [Trifolium pratense]